MAERVNLQALARALRPNKRGDAYLRPVIPATSDVDALFRILREEVYDPWRKAVAEIISLYTAPPAGLSRDADGLQLQWLVEQAQRAIDNRRVYQTEKLGQWVTGVANRNTLRTIASVKSATGVDVSASLRLGDVRQLLQATIAENTGLISRLNADTKARVERILLDGFINRKSQTEIARELRAAMGITWRRARLIARDQNEKLNAILTKYRNEQMGIKHFRWMTRLDDKVRRTHRAREGRVYSWATGAPIPERYPGVAINCRCIAEGVIEYKGSSWRTGGYRRRAADSRGHAHDCNCKSHKHENHTPRRALLAA